MKETAEYTSGIVTEIITSMLDLFLLPMLGLGLLSEDSK
jgi:hypothetical protein